MAKLKLLAPIQVRKTSYKNILVCFCQKPDLLSFIIFLTCSKRSSLKQLSTSEIIKKEKKKKLDSCQCYKRYSPTRGHTLGKAARSSQIRTNSSTNRLSSACTCFAFWLPVTLPAYMMWNRAQARKYFKQVMLSPKLVSVLLAICLQGAALFQFLLKAISWAF